jgi:hypothetical protein
LKSFALINLAIDIISEEISQFPLLKSVYLKRTVFPEEGVNYLKDKGVQVVLEKW